MSHHHIADPTSFPARPCATHPRRKAWRARALAAAALVAALVLVFAACGLLPARDADTLETAIAEEAVSLAQGDVPELALSPVGDIWDILSTRHVDRAVIDAAALEQGAIDALLAAADMTALRDAPIPAAPETAPRPEGVPAEFARLWDAWAAVFIAAPAGEAPPDAVALSRAAMRGMVRALGDPHSAYVPPQEYQLGDLQFTGSYQGIGANVQVRDGQFLLTPMPGSPAERAGIGPGDQLVSVDGVSIEGLSVLDIVHMVRGPEGTNVALGIIPLGHEGTLTIRVTRGDIELESVTWRDTPSGHAYIRLTSFYANTDEALEAALAEIVDAGAKGLILDMRDNPGGLLSTTINVASLFLDGGLVVYELNGAGERTEWDADGGGVAVDLPLILIVNELSASASEVLAGAFQDRGRAQVVGAATFGKGSVNNVAELSDGGGLYYSTARWYTPDGRLIEGDGIAPDVAVARGTPGSDAQLQRALDLMAVLTP